MRKAINKIKDALLVSDDWFREAFAEDYLWIYSHRTDEEADYQVKTILDFIAFKRKSKNPGCGMRNGASYAGLCQTRGTGNRSGYIKTAIENSS